MSTKHQFLPFGFCRRYEIKYNLNIPKNIKIIIQKYCKIYKIIACGGNHRGCLGIGHDSDLKEWTQLNPLKGIIGNIEDLYINDVSIMVINASHHVFVCGYNQCHRLGINNNGSDELHHLTEINHNKAIIMTSSGISNSYHTFIYCHDETLYGSGNNEFGQFGNEKKENKKFILSEIPTFWGNEHKLKQIKCTLKYSLFLMNNGDVFIFGDKYGSKPKITHKNIKEIAVGRRHHLLLNDNERLEIDGLKSLRIKEELIQYLNKKPIKQISSGYNHCLVLSTNHQCFSFGKNTFGQCGNGERGDSFIDTPYLLPFQHDFIMDVCCGGFHSLILTKRNNVHSFGWNYSNQCTLSSDDTYILSPFLLNKEKELNVNGGDMVIKIMATPDSSIIIMITN